MRMSRAVKGSVSVLLCLILLPMVTYSTMIIDASRLQSVRANIAGAGELTMNSMMSEYNALLEQMYGLFANCKTEEEMKPALKAYFQQTVEGKFLTQKKDGMIIQHSINDLVDYMLDTDGKLDESMLTDFLKVQLTDNFSAAPVFGSALANPNVLKRQIIEYMKYRGPISIASTLLGKLDYFKNADTQADACDKKVEYTQQLGELQKPCVEAFEAIETYNMGAMMMNAVANEGFENIVNHLIDSEYSDGWKEIIYDSKIQYERATVFYLLNAKSPFFNNANEFSYGSLSGEIDDQIYDASSEINYAAPEDGGDDYATKINKLRNKMNNLITIAQNECGYYNKELHMNGDKIHINIENQADGKYGFGYLNRYHVTGSSLTTDSEQEHFPNMSKIQGDDSAWIKPFQNPPAYGDNRCDEANFNTQMAFAKEAFKAQKEIAECKDSVKDLILKQKKIEGIEEAFGWLWHEMGQVMYDEFNHRYEEDLEKFEHEPDGDNKKYDKWNEFVTTASFYSDISRFEETRLALDKIRVEMQKYQPRIDKMLTDGRNNQNLFLNYAQAFNESGYSAVAALGMTLKMMKESLSTADGKLDEIITLVNNLEETKKAWGDTISNIDSDSTRAAMLSDFQSLEDQFKKEDIEKLKAVIAEIQTQLDDTMKLVKSAKYLGQGLFATATLSESFLDWAKEEGSTMHSRIVDGILESSVAQKANEYVWNKLGADDEYPVQPDFTNNETIKSTDFEVDTIYDTAKQLVKDHYEVDDGKISRFRVLDGIKDTTKVAGVDVSVPSAYTTEDKEAYKIDEMEKNGDELLDEDEKFVITLYNEYQASKKAEAATEEDTSTADNLTSAAESEISEAGEAPTTTTATPLASEDFAKIMATIESYCDQNEKNQESTPGNLETAKIEKGKKAADSKGGGALKAGKKMLETLKNIADTVVNNVYLEEYLTEMFTCRTDNQMLNSLTKDEHKKVLPVIMMNGYGNSSSGSKKLLNEDTEWYGKEIEYLLWGSSDLDANLGYTDAMIYIIRFALNAIYAFTAPDIQSYALELATAIAGWTVVGVPIVQACITILIALAESGYDLYLLHDGRDVPIYKSQATFVCSPTGLLKTVATEAAKKIVEETINEMSNKVQETLDKAIDNVADKVTDAATETLESYADDFKDTVSEYGKQQKDAIESAIKQQFITPVLNEILPLGSVLEAGKRYNTADPKALIASGVDKAFAKIIDNIDNHMEDGVIRDICLTIVTNETMQNEVKDQITSVVTEYFNSIDSPEIPDIDLEAELSKKLDDIMKKFNDKIDEAVDSATKYVTDAIKNAKDVTVDAAKSFVNERMEEATARLTGKATELVGDAMDKLPEGKNIDTGASGGVTLNYKEYCKIFMLIFVSANQNQMMQRAAVLITANMRHEASKPQSSFEIINANTLFSVNAQIQMNTLFPWPVKDDMDETSPDAGVKFDINSFHGSTMTINYCGVNGY